MTDLLIYLLCYGGAMEMSMPVSLWTTPQLVVMLGMLYRELSQRLSVNIAPISAQWQWDSRQWDDATIDNNMTFDTVAEMLSLQESPESEEEIPEPAPKGAPSNIRKREDEEPVPPARTPTEPPFPPPGHEQPPWKKTRKS